MGTCLQWGLHSQRLGGGVCVIAPVLPPLDSPPPKSGIEISIATPADDAELRELLRNSPVPGPISVTFEREPSFHNSCHVRGDFQVAVGRDRATGKIIGLG